MTIRIYRNNQVFVYRDVPKENIPEQLLKKIKRHRGFTLEMKIQGYINKFFRRNPFMSIGTIIRYARAKNTVIRSTRHNNICIAECKFVIRLLCLLEGISDSEFRELSEQR